MAEYDYAVFAGNIGEIYEKRNVGNDNRSVVDFTVATTRRRKNRKTDEWEDAPTRWRRVTAWNRLADNLVESFNKGDRIMVFGRVEMQDGYEDKDGNQRDPREQITAEDLGHSIQRWPAKTERDPQRNNNSNGGNKNNNSNKKKPAAKQESNDDDLLNDDDGLLDF